MSFLFSLANSEIQSGTLDLLNGVFDLYIVNATPASNNTTVNNLTLSSLPVFSLSNNFTSTKWSFVDTTLPLHTYSVAPVGFVISKRSSSSPQVTDRVIYFSEFYNSIGQVVTYSTGLFRINITFKSTGLIAFNATNEYFSGSYINTEAVPKGIVYLLGTNNNTIPYVNPQPSKIGSRYKYSGGTGVSGATSTNRNNADFSGTAISRATFYFYDNQIRLGVFGYNSSISNAVGLTIYGSNSLLEHTDAEIDNTSYWTTLGTISSIATGMNFITSNNDTYWTYLKLESNDAVTDNIIFGELEFYSSSIISSSLNLA